MTVPKKQINLNQGISEIITITSMKVYNRQMKLCDALEEMEKQITDLIKLWIRQQTLEIGIEDPDGNLFLSKKALLEKLT